jgi:hypothetical protein
MKKLVYLLSFMFVGITYAQVIDQDRTTQQTNRDNMDTRMDRATYYDIQDPSDYTFNNQNFRFTPNDRGDLTVSQMENGRETEIGNLRRTTANGYYIMTSTTDPNNVSFGRFDDEGNFRTYRYDRTTDSVIEEDYNIDTPTNIRGDQGDMRRNNPNRDNRGINNNRNNRNTNNQGVERRNTTNNPVIDRS